MNVLILGANGFIGSEIVTLSRDYTQLTCIIGSRSGKTQHDLACKKVSSTNLNDLIKALDGIDAVINCITGSEKTIINNANNLLAACSAQAKPPRIIHLSSMSVYGHQTGIITENSPLIDNLNWYGHAKIEAEKILKTYSDKGGELVILRPGCVNGKDSRLWNTRIETWLKQGKLGDLGAQGDGWSNLVHVTDVAKAALNALNYSLNQSIAVFNLASPDAPRWNGYFIKKAVNLGYTPVKRISRRQLQLTSRLGIVFKVFEHILKKIGIQSHVIPEALPPSLLTLFAESYFLDGQLVLQKQLISQYVDVYQE
jgi:nucleoside-diphosphate-sugar epimerase